MNFQEGIREEWKKLKLNHFRSPKHTPLEQRNLLKLAEAHCFVFLRFTLCFYAEQLSKTLEALRLSFPCGKRSYPLPLHTREEWTLLSNAF